MRFLIDQNLSPKVAIELANQGHDAVHVATYDLSTADDDEIFKRAEVENRVIVSADTDFGTLLAARKSKKPSVILLRLLDKFQLASEQVALISANLPKTEEDLNAGAIVVIEPNRIRIRKLPIGGE